jgi:hypothetical protein
MYTGYSVTVVLRSAMLDITVSVPRELNTATTSRGLLGNLNGDPSDDLGAPDGTVTDATASEREIFANFGEYCKYRNARYSPTLGSIVRIGTRDIRPLWGTL